MIMVPAQNIPNKQPYGSGYDNGDCAAVLSSLEGHGYRNKTSLGSDIVVETSTQMDAQDNLRSNRINETGSSSKDVHDGKDHESWLQLTIGGVHDLTARRSNYEYNTHLSLDPMSPGCCTSNELDLLPSGSFSQLARPLEFRPPWPLLPVTNFSSSNSYSTPSLALHQQHPRSCSEFPDTYEEDMDWSCRSIPQNTAYKVSWSSSSSSPSSFMPLSCGARPFQAATGMDVGGTTEVAFRIMDAPRSPHSGIWFMLQASQIQAKEPFLPQIPKSYLRIKNGTIQVRLLLKYLANKLRLGCDSEIEITCREKKLLPFLTLQHVRDNIWSPKNSMVTLLADTDSSTTDHVMVLHYGRSA